MRWDKANHILCVRLDAIGDVIMTTPAFKALKESRPPGRKLTLLTSRSGKAIAPLIPEIDEVIIFDAPWMKASAPRDSLVDLEMIRRLRMHNFDAAIIFTVFSQNPLPAAYLCYLGQIPLRLGYCRENPYQLLNCWIKDPDTEFSTRHEVERQLELVRSIGCETTDDTLSLTVPEIATQSVIYLLHNIPGFDLSRPWVVIHPGATAESRRYPASNYAAVADVLAREFDLQILFTGTDAEHQLVESIRTNVGVPTISLVGSLNLAEMAALVKLAPLLITNNTGPAHMAAAFNTPLVQLYASTNPQHTPWRGTSRVLSHEVACKNCFKSVCPMEHHDCLRLVNPLEVVAASIDLLSLSAS